MDKDPPKIRKNQVKFYLSPELDEDVERFIDSHRTIPSKTKMGEWALRFYMDMFNRSGGVIDGNGFPVLAAVPQRQVPEHSDTILRDVTGSRKPGRTKRG